MSKLIISVSNLDFEKYILPHLSHKKDHNRQKVSYAYVFNCILYVLKSGCSWRTLKPDNEECTWENIYYHFNKWSKDGSFEKLFSHSIEINKEKLALECLQFDGSHTPSKKGAKT